MNLFLNICVSFENKNDNTDIRWTDIGFIAEKSIFLQWYVLKYFKGCW